MINNHEGWQNGPQLDKLWLPEYPVLAAKSPQFIVGEGHNIIYITDLLFVDRVCRSSLWPKATTFDKFNCQGDLGNFSAKAIWHPWNKLWSLSTFGHLELIIRKISIEWLINSLVKRCDVALTYNLGDNTAVGTPNKLIKTHDADPCVTVLGY